MSVMDPGNIDLKLNFCFFTVTPPVKVVDLEVNIDTDISTDIEIVEDIDE